MYTLLTDYKHFIVISFFKNLYKAKGGWVGNWRANSRSLKLKGAPMGHLYLWKGRDVFREGAKERTHLNWGVQCIWILCWWVSSNCVWLSGGCCYLISVVLDQCGGLQQSVGPHLPSAPASFANGWEWLESQFTTFGGHCVGYPWVR